MRDQIKEIDNKIENLSNQSNNIWKDVQDLSDTRAELLSQVIIEEKLLSLPTWEFYNEYNLNCNSDWRDDELKPIVDLLKPDYHSHFNIGLYCRLKFNDGDVHLAFDSLEDMAQFIKEADLKVSLDQIQSKIGDLESKLSTLIKMRDKFKEII